MPTGGKYGNVGNRRSIIWRSTKPTLYPFALMWLLLLKALKSIMKQHGRRLSHPRLDMPVGGKPNRHIPCQAPDVRDGDVSMGDA